MLLPFRIAAGRASPADPVDAHCRRAARSDRGRPRSPPDRCASRGDPGFPGSGAAATVRPHTRVAHRTRPALRRARSGSRTVADPCPGRPGPPLPMPWPGRRGPAYPPRDEPDARCGSRRSAARSRVHGALRAWTLGGATPADDRAARASADQNRRPPGRDAHAADDDARRRPTATETAAKDRLGADRAGRARSPR